MRFALYLLCRSEWIAKERGRLQLNGKGSAQAEFQFVTSYDRLFRSHCIEPLYDFPVAVPFAEIMHEKDLKKMNFMCLNSLNLVIFEFGSCNAGI